MPSSPGSSQSSRKKEAASTPGPGMTFVYAYSLVITTAVAGVVIFEFRSFLAVATIASSYSLFSGFRATRLRGARPTRLDSGAAILGLSAPVLFITAMHSLKTPWAPVLTWTVLGSLMLISSYDLGRNFISSAWLKKTWVHEHIFKIVGAFDALTATFAATIFPHFQPWSALLPHLLGNGVILFFFIAGPRAWSVRRPAPALLPEPPLQGSAAAPEPV